MHEPHFILVLVFAVVAYGLARLFVSTPWAFTIVVVSFAIIFPITSLSLVLTLLYFGVMVWLFDGGGGRDRYKPPPIPKEEFKEPTSKYFNGFYYDYSLECKINLLVFKGDADRKTVSKIISSEYSDCKQIKSDKDFDDFIDGFNKFVRE